MPRLRSNAAAAGGVSAISMPGESEVQILSLSPTNLLVICIVRTLHASACKMEMMVTSNLRSRSGLRCATQGHPRLSVFPSHAQRLKPEGTRASRRSFCWLRPSYFVRQRRFAQEPAARLTVAKSAEIFKTCTFSYTFQQLPDLTSLNTITYIYT
jgi:hypothetical protein